MKIKLTTLLVSALALLGAFLLLAPQRSDDQTRELAGSVTSGITIAYQGKTGTDAPPRSKKPSAAQERKLKRQSRAIAAQRRAFARKIASPAAKRERAQSREQFRGLSPNRALAAVENHQKAFIERPTVIAPKVREGEQIIGYKGADAASVKLPDGSIALAQTQGIPLAAPVDGPAGKGRLEAVDLSLGEQAGGWVPRRPAVPITLPKNGAADATVGGHLTIDLPNNDGAAQLVDGTRAFYAEQLTDTDIVLEPDNRGLDISWVLRSPEAPSVLPLDLGLTKGEQPEFRVTPRGTVDVIVGGKTVSSVEPLTAWDAQGSQVPATYRVDGDELVVDVPHASKDFAYPIVVDPLVWWGVGPAMEDNNGPGQPVRYAWQPHTFQPEAFWWSNASEPWLAIALNDTQNQGSAWWTYHPIRQSSAFRADFYNVRRENGNASLMIGLYGPGGWNETAISEYFIHGWSSQPHRAPGPFYIAPHGITSTHVTACASDDCVQGGNLDNFLAFQLYANGARTRAFSAAFDGAITWHRESTPPRINAVTIEGVSPGQWTNRGTLTAVLSADDDGIGFCSDGNMTDPGLRKQPFVVEREGTGGNYGFAAIGGCAGQSHWMPAPGHVDLRWTEGEWGPRLPEGESNLRFVAQDMFGNRATQNQTVRIDRMGPPTVDLGGRLSDYLVEPGPNGSVPDGIRTLFGPADITVSANDAYGAPAVSGVNRVEFFVSPLGAGGWGPWNHFKTLTGCSEGGAKVCGRLVSSEIPATNAGTYQMIVRAWDNAGNSRDVWRQFSRGGGEISTVVEAQSTARWVPLGARRTTGNPTQATFKWRAAAAATPTVMRDWADIPSQALQNEGDSTRLSNGTVPMTQEAGAAAGVMVTDRYVLDLDKLIADSGIGDLGNGKIQIRAEFNGAGTPAERLSEDVAIRLDRGGRDTDDATDALGPGTVDLLTGNLAVGEADASISGVHADLSLTRTYNSRYAADKGRLGPGWSIGLPADETAEFAKVVDLGDPARANHRTTRWDPDLEDYVEEPVAGAVFEDVYPAVEILDATGAGFVFEQRESDGAFLPEAGFENYSLKRLPGANGATASFELTDNDNGTVTKFSERLDNPAVPTKAGEPEHGSFGVTGFAISGVPGSPQWTYSDRMPAAGSPVLTPAKSLPMTVVAPTAPTRTCTAAAVGCQQLSLGWIKHAGSGEPRLESVSVTAWDPSVGALQTRELTRYSYSADPIGRLIRVDDVRSKSFTKYAYDGNGLLTTVTEGAINDAGTELTEPAHTVAYASLTDDKTPGRFSSTTRNSATQAVRYGDREFSGANPYDLSKSTIAKWGQTVTPFRATAVFSADVVPATDAATLRKADISYLDALGRTINRAQPGGRISVTDLNKYGNIVRTLTPGARAKALLNTADTTGEANRLATISEYETVQREVAGVSRSLQRVVRVLAPLRTVKLESGAEVSGRTVTSTLYDEDFSPSLLGMPFNLPTTVRTGVLTGASSSGSGGTVSDLSATRTYYHMPSREPERVIADFGTGRANVTSWTVRDEYGREIERRLPMANASAAATTTKTTYYGPGAPGACGTNPAWDGLVCRVEPGAQPAASPRPALPVKTYELYDFWLKPTRVVETVAGTQRVTTQTFDARHRPLLEKVTGTGAAIGTTKHVYDAFGRELETQKVGGDDVTVASRIKRTYDALGRVTAYEDADGNKRTTSYDLLGRVAAETDLKGTTTIVGRTIGYDPLTGDTTSITETGTGGIGTINAAYDGDGRPVAVRYQLPGTTPGEVTKSIEYGNDGMVTRQAYTKTAGCASACLWYENKVVRSAHGQIIDDISTGQVRKYTYDGLGRLTAATDKQGSAACVTRSYTYDANSNRKSRRSETASTATAPCLAPGSTGTVISAVFDDADRATTYTDASGTGTVNYDAFGRITKLPWQASGGSQVESSYFVNDLAHQIWTGPWRETNALDPANRLLTRTLDNAGTVSHVDRNAYGDDTDEPMFTSTGTTWRRFAEDMTGDMVAQTNQAGQKTLQLANIRGDTIAEAPLAATTTGLSKTIPVDEFGVHLGTSASFADRSYGFLGAKQRESIHNGLVQAMGLRTYSPWTGRFLQVDPVLSGSANAYEYAYQDPVNQTDLDGACPLCIMAGIAAGRAAAPYVIRLASKKAVKRVARGRSAKPGQKYLSKTKSNYRANLIRRTGVDPGKGFEAHHMFPQKFVDKFKDLGINIHDPIHITWWKKRPHRQAARAINKEWEKFFETHKGTGFLEKDAAMRLANAQAVRYKLSWRYYLTP